MDKKVTTRKKRRKIHKFFTKWINNNIFKYKMWDGILYIVLYICIPVIITAVSLDTLSNENVKIIYCYVSILISALNGFYDAANRWDNNGSYLINIKVCIIGMVNLIICTYSIYIILYILISNDIKCRHDSILMTYFVTIAIAMIDALCCFVKKMALQDLMKEEW